MTKGKIVKKTPNLQWFRNAAKSLGYSSSELVESMIPNTTEFIKNNREYVKDMHSDLRDFKATNGRMKHVFDGNTQVVTARNAFKNAVSDIKSGNIYNKDRQDSIHDEGMDFNGEDFGMSDFSVDDDFSPDEDKPYSPVINIRNVTPPISPNSPIIKVMENQTRAIVETSQANSMTTMGVATNQLVLQRKIGSGMLQGLDAINDNMAMLVNFQGESMSKYVSTSMKYYEDSLNVLNETLVEIRKGSSQYDAQEATKRPGDPAEDVFGMNGSLNAKGYMSMVKKNLSGQMSMNPILQSLKTMFEDTDTLKFFAASPLSFIATKITTTLIPKFLQQSMENFDKSFSNFFPALLMRINKGKGGNPILDLLGEIFGINTSVKQNIDLSKYNKGAVPFDGLTKKAVTEVIPGYLRKILAAVSGKAEVAFDYDKGTFGSVREMKEQFENKKENTVLGVFSDTISELKLKIDSIANDDLDEKRTFKEGVDKFFVELAKKGSLVNPNLRTDKDGSTIDELSEVHDFDGSPIMQQMFRNMIQSMPKNQQMKVFGRDVLDARSSVNRMMQDSEDNPLMNNVSTIFNKLTSDEHLKKGANGEMERKKGFGLFNPTDNYNLTSLDYLRDIKTVLYEGIRVFTVNKDPNSTASNPANGIEGKHNKVLQSMDKQKTDYQNSQTAKIDNKSLGNAKYSDEQISTMRSKGAKVVSSYSDLYGMEDGDMQSHFNNYADANGEKSGQKGGAMQWVGKFFKGKSQDRYNMIREKADDLLKKPAQLLQSVFSKIDGTMYSMVFGSNKSGGADQPSFLTKTISMMRENFAKMGTWVQTKVLDPVKESLFGKNGLITKMKDSDFFKNMKSKMGKMGEFMFGKPDGEGKRGGGLMSDTANSMMDMWDHSKFYFTGKGYTNRAGQSFGDNKDSVFGEVKKMFGNFKETINHYLVGDKKNEDPDQKRGILSGAIDSLKMGFTNFQSAIFGKRTLTGKDSSENMKALGLKIKERAPKALASGMIGAGVGVASALGSFGMLGSLLLPGGPLGGAIVGTTIGFLTQSEKFNSWLFGPKDADGARIGGAMSKSTQDFLKKNRVGIIGGATLGAAKSMLTFGMLPSWFLPGGPVGGALLGMGTSMLVRSEAFQKMMFGAKDVDGVRMGGVIQKMFGSDAKAKNLMGNVGAGAISGAALGLVTSNLGIMGAMLIPGGPIGGAILGAAAGIALSSDRWKTALFGDWDEESNKRKGGLLGKFTNWFKLEVQEPLKNKFTDINLNMKEWFTKAVANPFRDALDPIKTEFKYMTDKMKDMFIDGWDSFKEKIGDVFEKNVGKPFGLFMQENVMKPLKGFFSRIVGGIGKVFGTIFGAPFQAMKQMSDGLREKQMKRGLKTTQANQWEDIQDFKGRRSRGEKMGLFNTKNAEGEKIGKGFAGRVNDMYFNKKARDEARHGEFGAHYAKSEEERIAKRDLEQSASFKKQREELETKKGKLALRRKLGLKYDYDNFDEQGRNVSKIYDIPVIKSKIKDGTLTAHRKIEDKVNVSVKELFGADASADTLTKAQKKQLSKAIKKGLKGNSVKDYFGIGKEKEEATATTETASSTATSDSTPIINSIESMTTKLSETFKIESTKEEITKRLVPAIKESNEHLQQIVTRIGDFIGNSSKVFKVKKSGAKIAHAGAGNTTVDDSQDETSDRELSVTQGYEAHHARESKRTPKDKGSLLQRISTDVRTVAQEVHGQLDGLGKNMFHVRKILQKQNSMVDGDLSGSANRDRVGFLGKIRRAMYKPLDFVKEQLTKGLEFFTNKIKAFGDGVARIGKAIISIPVNIGKAMWTFTKELGHVAKETVLSIAKLPGKLLDIVGAGFQAAAETIKMVGPAIGESLKGVAKIFSGAMTMAAHSMIGFGKGVGAFFHEVGKGAGKVVAELGKSAASLIGTIGKTIGGTLKIVTESMLEASKQTLGFVFAMTQKITDFTLGTVTMIGKQLKQVGESLFEIVTSPINFFAKSMGKLMGWKQEVFIKGGTIDLVRNVESIGDKDDKPKEDKPKDDGPIKVIMEDCINICPDSITNAFSKIFPLPVVIEADKSSRIVEGKLAGGVETPLDKTPSVAGSMLTALSIFDHNNDKQEKVKTEDDKFQLGIKEKAKNVKGKTAESLLKSMALKEEKDFVRDNETKQTTLLEKIANSTTEHKDGWFHMFGPKGILAAALLALLPFLKDIIGWLKDKFNPPGLPDGGNMLEDLFNLGEDPTKRQDADGSIIKNRAYRESLTKGGARQGTRLLRRNAPALAKLAGEAGSVARAAIRGGRAVLRGGKAAVDSSVGRFIGRKIMNGKEFVQDKMGKWFAVGGSELADEALRGSGQLLIGSGDEIAQSVLRQGARKIGPNGKPVIDAPKPKVLGNKAQLLLDGPKADVTGKNPKSPKFGGGKGIIIDADFVDIPSNEKLVKESIDGDAKKVQKQINKMFEIFFKLGKVVEELGPGSGETAAKIKDSMGKVFNLNVIKKFRKKLNKAFLKQAVKTTGAVLTAGLTEVAFTAYDLGSGAYEASHIFKINDEYVDAKMRIAASVTKALFGYFPVIDILVEIFDEQTGFSMKQHVAEIIYAVLASTQDVAELDNNQLEFKAEKDAYNKANGTKISLNAYNDKQNKTLWGKYMAEPTEKLWKGTKTATKAIFNASPVGLVKNGIKGFRDDDLVRKNLNIKDDRKLTWKDRLRSGGAEVAENATFGLAKSENVIKAGNWVGNKVKNGANWVGDKISNTWDRTSGARGKVIDAAKWTGGKIVDGAQGVWNGTKWVGGKIADGAKWTGDKLAQGAKATGKVVSSVWNKTGGRLTDAYSNEDKIKSNFGIKGEGKITKGMRKSSVAGEWIEMATRGKLDAEKTTKTIYGLGLLADDFVTGMKDKFKENISEPIKKKWDDTKKKVAENVEELRKKTSDRWEEIKEDTSTKWSAVKTVVGGATEILKKKTSDKWEEIKKDTSTKWSAVKTVVGGVTEIIKKKTSDKWEEIKEDTGTKWSAVKTVVGGVTSIIKKKTSDKWEEIKKDTGKAWDDTKKSVNDSVEKVKKKSGEIWGDMKDNVSKGWSNSLKIVDKLMGQSEGDTEKKWKDTKNSVATGWTNMKKKVTDKIEDVQEDTQKHWKKFKEDLTGTWDDVTGAVDDGVESIKKSITDLIDNITKPFKNLFKGAVEKATKKLEDLGWGSGNIPKSKSKSKSKSTPKFSPKSKSVPKTSAQFGRGIDPTNKFGKGAGGPEGPDAYKNGMVYYSQKDSRWSGKDFGGGVKFGEAGCGPTAAAMVVSSMTGKRLDPTQAFDYAKEKGYVDPEKGTSASLFQDIGSQYGVNIQRGSNKPDEIKANLRQNKPVILRGQGGNYPFTDGGHFVVATGLNSSGNVMVNDPTSESSSKAYNLNKLMNNTTSSYVASNDYGMGMAKAMSSYGDYGQGMVRPEIKGLNASTNEFGMGVFDAFKITSKYGPRIHPVTGKPSKHTGIDLVRAHRSPVQAFVAGEVMFAGRGGGYDSSYGNVVSIRDVNGYYHLYAHLDSTVAKKGQRVTAGQVIGRQGTTGRSTGSHLHYEVRKGPKYGTDVNPTDYLNQFKAGKGALFSPIDSPDGSGEEPMGDPTFLDLMGKMGENFNLAIDNMYSGEKKRLVWGDSTSSYAPGTSDSKIPFTGLDTFNPTDTKGKILKKTAQLTIKHESGGNYFFAKNDVKASTGQRISPSIGVLQWRGGLAKKLMQNIHKQMPKDAQAKYYADQVNWNDNTPWSSGAQGKLQHFLAANPKIVKGVQDKFVLDHVQNANLSQVYKYGVGPGKIKDPRSITMLGEIANTGPALVKSFMSKYKKGGGGNEFPHFYNEFMRKSYWGPKPIYKNRLGQTYSALKNWNVESGKGGKLGNGAGGPDKTPIRSGIAKIASKLSKKLDLPKLGLPKFNLPKLSLPNFNLPNLKGIFKGGVASMFNNKPDLLDTTVKTLKLYDLKPNGKNLDNPSLNPRADVKKSSAKDSEKRLMARLKALDEDYGKGTTKDKVSSSRTISTLGTSQYNDSYVRRQAMVSAGEKDYSILKEAMGILKDIANNTGATSEGIANMKTISLDSKGESEKSVIVLNQNNKNSSMTANPVVGAMGNANNAKSQSDFSVASKIAAGR